VVIPATKAHFAAHPDKAEQFKEWRKDDIQFIVRNGYTERCSQHILDGGFDTTKSIFAKSSMKETFHLGFDVFYETEAFTRQFDRTPLEAGYPEVFHGSKFDHI